MKKVIKFLIGLGLGLLLFYWIVDRAGLEAVERAAQLFWSLEGLAILGVTFLIVIVSGWRWKVVLSCQGEEVSFRELIKVWTVGYSIDYLTPVSLFGGEALRTYMAGSVLDVDWEKGFSSVIIDKVLDGTFHLIFIIIGLIIFLRLGYFPDNFTTWLVIFLVILFSVGLAVFYSRAIGKKSILLLFFNLFGLEKARVKSTKNGEFIFNAEGNVLRYFSPNKLFFWKGVGISLLRHLLHYLRIFLLVYFLVGLEPVRSLAVQGFSNLSLLLPLPAGLGGLEAVSAFGFEAMDMGFETGTSFAMTWRAADLIVCVFGIIFGIYLSVKVFKLKIKRFFGRF